MSGKLLIVEDEFVIAQDLRRIVTGLGYAVTAMAKSADEALNKLSNEAPDLFLLDINILGERTGIELAQELTDKHSLPFLFVTSYSDTGTLQKMNAVNSLGYILKPFNQRDIRVALELAFAKLTSNSSIDVHLEKPIKIAKEHGIIGKSDSFLEALKKVNQVAQTNATVLLSGETGTGKELFMRAIHQGSKRSKKQLVKVNCAALPAELIESVLFGHEKGSFTGATEKRIGKFELADSGTIFLDEIGELPLASQAKLLRCLQEKEIESIGGRSVRKIDVRVIAATNKDLSNEVKEGNFRADLFYRLNIFPILIPPLRERNTDIPLLANHFLQKSTAKIKKGIMTISDKTISDFEKYEWPGNVRELEHCIERAVILAEGKELTIPIDHQEVEKKHPHREEFELRSLEDMEREQIIHTLQYCNGKIRGLGGAAEILKLHPNTLDFRMKKLGIGKAREYKHINKD